MLRDTTMVKPTRKIATASTVSTVSYCDARLFQVIRSATIAVCSSDSAGSAVSFT